MAGIEHSELVEVCRGEDFVVCVDHWAKYTAQAGQYPLWVGGNGGAMKYWILILVLALGFGATASAQGWQERLDWSHFFADAGVQGTMVVSDERAHTQWVYGEARARTRFLPASTFKIPHTLFALDGGIVRDEFQIFPWDGTRRDIASWNTDQTLRSAMRNSVVWVYQRFARQLGERRERHYLRRIAYGNADASGGLERFWLEGGLRISAHEQVEFLQRLYRNTLPFRVAHQRLVKDLMIVEAGRDWILRAKTGWGARMEPQVGWWVGWVERPEGAILFALNIEMPHKGDDLPKREGIARAVLRSIDALPSN
jgi:beta-lactamase class D